MAGYIIMTDSCCDLSAELAAELVRQLDSIFDAAPSAPTSAADTRKGMGIGLSICKAIINAHGGEIRAQNHPDGAEFYFTLPKEDKP